MRARLANQSVLRVDPLMAPGNSSAPKERTTDIRGHVPDLRGRVPSARSSRPGADLAPVAPSCGPRGTEPRASTRTWRRVGALRLCASGSRGLRASCSARCDFYLRLAPLGGRSSTTNPPSLRGSHSSHLDTPTIRARSRASGATYGVAAAADYFYKKPGGHGRAARTLSARQQRRASRRRGGPPLRADSPAVDLLMFPGPRVARTAMIGKVHSPVRGHRRAPLLRQIFPLYVIGTHDAMPPGQTGRSAVRPLPLARHKVRCPLGAPSNSRDENKNASDSGEVRAFGTARGPPRGARTSGADLLVMIARCAIRGARALPSAA